MEGVGAYGGGKAGGTFDPVSFAQRPQVILRAVSWVSVGPRAVGIGDGRAAGVIWNRISNNQ